MRGDDERSGEAAMHTFFLIPPPQGEGGREHLRAVG